MGKDQKLITHWSMNSKTSQCRQKHVTMFMNVLRCFWDPGWTSEFCTSPSACMKKQLASKSRHVFRWEAWHLTFHTLLTVPNRSYPGWITEFLLTYRRTIRLYDHWHMSGWIICPQPISFGQLKNQTFETLNWWPSSPHGDDWNVRSASEALSESEDAFCWWGDAQELEGSFSRCWTIDVCAVSGDVPWIFAEWGGDWDQFVVFLCACGGSCVADMRTMGGWAW